jgi:flagellar biosynthesis protein FlhG
MTDARTSTNAHILAITSGKGGVGKTFVAANLAAALAERGERVLVLDADLGLANLDVVLNLTPKLNLHDVFRGRASLDDAVLPAPGGFSVVLAGSGLVEYSRLTSELRDQLLNAIDALAPRFDRIILDTGAGISDVVLYTISLAEDVLVVATPEPTSLTDAYAVVKVLAMQQRRDELRLLVNQVARAGDGRAIRSQLQQVVDRYVKNAAGKPTRLEFIGEIPDDPTVREAVQQRRLLLEAFPGCPAAQALRVAADRLVLTQS